MLIPLVNRRSELHELALVAKGGGLVVVFGRRRMGKTRLLSHWLKKERGFYSQAIEGAVTTQLEQTLRDLSDVWMPPVSPRSWSEFFELFDREPHLPTLCLDEFPYLVAADPSLPSVIQRFLDHRRRHNSLLVLAGSSIRMMHDTFLSHSAPLYGRAKKIMHLKAMSYGSFCDAIGLDSAQMDTFTKFALVGGVPRYWEFVSKKQTPLQLADALYFGENPALEFEPMRLLRDEGFGGHAPLSLLEVVGRGAERPSEIASRLETPVNNLNRLFAQLVDASLLERVLPFGESTRTTKRVLYRLEDPSTRFWFRVFSPHRTRWARYTDDEKKKYLRDHASTVFEDVVRVHFSASRFWEANAEFASVHETPRHKLEVTEVKWARLSASARDSTLHSLEKRFATSTLAARFKDFRFSVIDASFLRALSETRANGHA